MPKKGAFMNTQNVRSRDYFFYFNIPHPQFTASDIPNMSDGQVGDDEWHNFIKLYKKHGKAKDWDKKGVYLFYRKTNDVFDYIYAGKNNPDTETKKGTLLQRIGGKYDGHYGGNASGDLYTILCSKENIEKSKFDDYIKLDFVQK